MRIALLGAGSIGTVLAQRLSDIGHEVKVANSRAPETVNEDVLRSGATATWAADVTDDADVVIVSVNYSAISSVAEHVRAAPGGAVVIDASNYYPRRDGPIEGLGGGQNESEWVRAVYGRPVVKAWNTITTDSFIHKASEPGSPARVALPVSADDEQHRATAMSLVEQTGFDAFDAGPLRDSWRQQPGTPAYATDLDRDQLDAALERADARRAARRRDLLISIIEERAGDEDGNLDQASMVALARLIF
ncbi:NADPH-dependent F420 reductase [Arthrobacter sp. NPDC092385]|uniref:NADPH-dependent F420 reductase n=1 Tax=Arthrobacter sp. NPDC092385 TaxID=3363943 RepID=UPI0038087F62